MIVVLLVVKVPKIWLAWFAMAVLTSLFRVYTFIFVFVFELLHCTNIQIFTVAKFEIDSLIASLMRNATTVNAIIIFET